MLLCSEKGIPFQLKISVAFKVIELKQRVEVTQANVRQIWLRNKKMLRVRKANATKNTDKYSNHLNHVKDALA